MKYEGLLSFEEADKCIDTGQYPHWFVGYMGDGVTEILSRCAQGWIRAHTPSYMPVNQDDYLGLAPTLGHPLPMSTVRKDGSWICLLNRPSPYGVTHYGDALIKSGQVCRWGKTSPLDFPGAIRSYEGWLPDNHSPLAMPDEYFVGWYPIVTQQS